MQVVQELVGDVEKKKEKRETSLLGNVIAFSLFCIFDMCAYPNAQANATA